MSRPRYGEPRDGMQRFWYVDRLWELAEALPVEEVAIDDIRGPDEVTWYYPGGPAPTCRSIAEHCRRINAADLSYPILLTEDGCVFDGMHRIARCLMEGRTTVLVRRFPVNPEPDEAYPIGPSGERLTPG